MTPSVTKLNPIVVTAHRSLNESFKVPQSISVFESEEFGEKGQTTVTEIIENAPGVDVNDAGPFRVRPVIRGMYGSRTLVLVDGERLNDHREVVDFAGVSMSLVDVNEIERVEVLNGPSSVLYGSDAMGGVINILTKERNFSEALQPFINYSSSYSVKDELSSNRVNFGVEANKFSVSAGLLYKEAKDDYAPPGNWQNHDPRYNIFRSEFYDSLNSARGTSWSTDHLVNSKARINNYDLGLAYKLSARHKLNFDAGIFRGSDIGFPGVPNDSTPFYFFWPRHDRDNFSISFTGTGFNGTLAKVNGKFYYQKISKDFSTDFMDAIVIPAGPPPNPPTITPMTSFSTTEVSKYGLNLQGLIPLSSQGQLTLGVDSWEEVIDGGVTSITRFVGFGPFPFNDTSVSASVPENKWHSVGIYASSEFELNSVLLTAGGRFDNFWLNTAKTPGYVDDNDNPLPSEDDHSVNGSLGLVVPITKMVNAVGNLGTAYRVPNIVERFFYGSASGSEVRPNPDIKPERAVTMDLGVKAVNDYIGYSIIGFYSDYSDFTQLQNFATDTATFRPLWRYENVEDVSIYGVETTIEGKLNNGFYGGLIFSYQHGENKTQNEPLFVSPVKTTFKIGYRESNKQFFGELNLHKVEEQNRVPAVSALDDIATKGYTLVNSMAGVNLSRYFKLTLNANNLFDEVYSQPFNGRNPDNPVPEPGRNFILSAKVNLDI
jgi:hemoglobin/transferrin/lactoferrin receptor protein